MTGQRAFRYPFAREIAAFVLAVVIGLAAFAAAPRVPVFMPRCALGPPNDSAEFIFDECHFREPLLYPLAHFRDRSYHPYYLQKSLSFLATGGFLHFLKDRWILKVTTEEGLFHRAMGIVNALWMGVAALFLSLCCRAFGITRFWAVFVLFFVNFGFLKFFAYYSMLGDISTIAIATAIMFFYWTARPWWLLACAALAAFINPLLFYSTFFLFCFRRERPDELRSELDYSPKRRAGLARLRLACFIGWAVLYLCVAWYGAVARPDQILNEVLTWGWPKFFAEPPVVAASAVIVVIGMYFLMDCFNLAALVDVARWRSSFQPYRAALWLCGFFTVRFVVRFFSQNTDNHLWLWSQKWTMTKGLAVTTLYGLSKPGSFLLGHVGFFGSVVVLLVLFYPRFREQMRKMDLGASLLLAAYLLLVGLDAESRHLAIIYPWIVLMVAAAVGQVGLSTRTVAVILAVNIASSLLWVLYPIVDRRIPYDRAFLLSCQGAGLLRSEYLVLLGFCILAFGVLWATFSRELGADRAGARKAGWLAGFTALLG